MLCGQSRRGLWIKAKHRAAENESRTMLQRDGRGSELTSAQHLEKGTVRLETAVGGVDVGGAIDRNGYLAGGNRARRILLAPMEVTTDEIHARRRQTAFWVVLHQH